jgi:hypothetical protein
VSAKPLEVICYAAGFFDGEGSIDIRYECKAHKNGKRYERFYLRVCVVQIVRDPLDMLAAHWGGSICKRTNGIHNWVLTTASAAAFLEDVLSFLLVKKREAEIGLELQATMRGAIVNTAGSKGVDRLSDEVRQRRFDLLHEMRNLRLDKGLYARPRAHVPATRMN